MSDTSDDDDVPMYDVDDPEGDRQPYLADSKHKDIQDIFPDEEP